MMYSHISAGKNGNIFDFDGKQIVVDGETGAKRPTPIITSISIDTDGDNNALKTAQINLTIFTLNQLEMFELFFCRPGFNILLEFGNNFSLKENLLNKYKDFRGLNNKQTIFGSIQGQRDTLNAEKVIIAKNNYKDLMIYISKSYNTIKEKVLHIFNSSCNISSCLFLLLFISRRV